MPTNIRHQRALYNQEFTQKYPKQWLLFLLHKIICSYPDAKAIHLTPEQIDALDLININYNSGSEWPYTGKRFSDSDSLFTQPQSEIRTRLTCSNSSAYLFCRFLFTSLSGAPYISANFDTENSDFQGYLGEDFKSDLKDNLAVKFLVAAIYENLGKFEQAIQYYFEIGQDSQEVGRPLVQRAIQDILDHKKDKEEIEAEVLLGQVKAAEYFLQGCKDTNSKTNTVMIDHPKAVDILQGQLKRKNPPLQAYFVLGRCYQNGWGVERDLIKAVENFTQAKDKLVDAAIACAMVDYEAGSHTHETLAPEAAKKLFGEYQIYYNKDDKADSNKILSQLEKLAGEHKSNKNVQHHLFESYLLANQFEKALEIVSNTANSAEETQAFIIRANRLWGAYLLEKKQFEKALQRASVAGNSLLEIEEYTAKVYYEWGDYLKEDKKFAGAEEKYKQALGLNHPNATATLGECYYLHGVYQKDEGEFTSAIESFDQAIACNNFLAHLELATLYLKGKNGGNIQLANYYFSKAAELITSPQDKKSVLSAISGPQADECFDAMLFIDGKFPRVFSSYLLLIRQVHNINGKLIEWRNQLINKELADDFSALKRAEYVWQLNSVLIEMVDLKNVNEVKALSGNTLYQVDVNKKELQVNALFTSLQKNYAEFQAALTAWRAPKEATANKNSFGKFFSSNSTDQVGLAASGNLIANSLLIDAQNLPFSPTMNLLKSMNLERWKFYVTRASYGCKSSANLTGDFLNAVWVFKIETKQLEITPFSLALYLLKFPEEVISHEALVTKAIRQSAEEFFASWEFWLSDNGVSKAITNEDKLFKNMQALAKSVDEIANCLSYQALSQRYSSVIDNPSSSQESETAPSVPLEDQEENPTVIPAETSYEDLHINAQGGIEKKKFKDELFNEFQKLKDENKELKKQNSAKDRKIKDLEENKREAEKERDLLRIENSQLKEDAVGLKQMQQSAQPPSATQLTELLAQQQAFFLDQLDVMQKQNQQQISVLQQQMRDLTQFIQSASLANIVPSAPADNPTENTNSFGLK